jgi:hypothetical protein
MSANKHTFMKSLMLIPLLGIVFLVSAAGGQDLTPRQRAEEFLSTLVRGDTDKAYDKLFAGSELPTQKPGSVDAATRQTAAGLPLYGKPIGAYFMKTVPSFS